MGDAQERASGSGLVGTTGEETSHSAAACAVQTLLDNGNNTKGKKL